MLTLLSHTHSSFSELFTKLNPAYTIGFDRSENRDTHFTIRIYTRNDLHIATASIRLTSSKRWDCSMWPSNNPWLATVRAGDPDMRETANHVRYDAGGSFDSTTVDGKYMVTEKEFIRVATQWIRRVMSGENIALYQQHLLQAMLNQTTENTRYRRVYDTMRELGFARESTNSPQWAPASNDDDLRVTMTVRPSSQPTWTRDPASDDTTLPAPHAHLEIGLSITDTSARDDYQSLVIELRAYAGSQLHVTETRTPSALFINNYDRFLTVQAEAHTIIAALNAAVNG